MLRKTLSSFLILFLLSGASQQGLAQSRPMTCSDIKRGIFYLFNSDPNSNYLFLRDSTMQREIGLNEGDTTYWHIKWEDECTYRLHYFKGPMEEDSRKFALAHDVVVKVKEFGEDYYIYQAYIDDESKPAGSDTIWTYEKIKFEKQIVAPSSYQIIRDEVAKDRVPFGPDSKYALVYVYRPGKLLNSLGNYLVYFDDKALCIAKNNTGYLFRVYHQGPLEVKSVLRKDTAGVKLNLKYGQRYYVKSMIHWTITNRLYNYKLETKLMPAEEGAAEFEELKSN